jgi:hypothetical protein
VRRLRRAKSEKEKVTDTGFFKWEMSRTCGGIRELKLKFALNLNKSGCNES